LSIRRRKKIEKKKEKLENERFEGYVNKTKMKKMDSRDDENVLFYVVHDDGNKC